MSRILMELLNSKTLDANGITLNELAKISGISNTYFNYIKAGKIKNPGREKIIAIAIGLNYSLEEIDKALSSSIPNNLFRYFIMKNIKQDEFHNYYWQLNIKDIAASIKILGKSPASKDSHYTGETLFIEGANSDYIVSSDHKLLKKHFRKLQIAIISGAGHWVQADKPKEVVEKIIHFIKEKH